MDRLAAIAMTGEFHIRRLAPEDAEALVRLRREALAGDPLAFGASADDHKALSVDFLRSSLADPATSAVLGLLDGADLVGMAGVVRATERKRRHRAHVWGMYISPRARGRGAGRRLLAAAVAQARSWPGVEQLRLSVTGPSVAAWRLYASSGFREWGREPRALLWEGQYVEEIHLLLELWGGAT